MARKSTPDHQLIYLDIEFIADLYDSVNKLGVPTTVSKTQGGGANISAVIANAGIQATETRQYKVSTKAMFESLKGELSKYPNLEQRPANNAQLFWLDGNLKAQTQQNTMRQNGEIIRTDLGKFFFINSDIIDTALLTASHYFTYNYSPILDQLPPMQREFSLEVRCLLKLISENKRYSGELQGEFLGVPLVILEKQTSFPSN